MLAVDKGSDKFVCFVCGHRFRHPRILPCLHTFCTGCILSLQTYPIISQTESSDAADSDVDWFPSRDSDCSPHIIQPPRKFDSPEHLWSTPLRSRSKQRKVKLKFTRSKSCREKSGTPEEGQHLRPRSLNRDSSSSSDKTEDSSSIVVRSRRGLGEIYNNGVSLTASPILADWKRIIMCPICWKEVQVSTTLQELPRNLIVERYLLQDEAKLSGTDLVCGLCNDVSTTCDDDNDHSAGSNVTVRCLDCYENLCSLCETAHRRQKRTSTHTLVRLDHPLNADGTSVSSFRTLEFVSDSLPTSETKVVGREGFENSDIFKLTNLLKFDHIVSKESQDNVSTSDGPGTVQQPETDRISQKCENLLLEHAEDIQQYHSVNIAGLPSNIADQGRSATCLEHQGRSATCLEHQGRSATCLEHEGEELKLFCVTCEANICLHCVLSRHRSHDCQFVTRELFQRQMDDVDRLIQTIIPKVRAVDEQIKSLTQMKDLAVERSNEVRDEVNAFMDSFVEAVEIHRKQLQAQVTSLCEAKVKVLSVTQEHLLKARADVGQTCQFLGQLLASATDLEMLSLKQLLVHRLTAIRDLPSQPHFPETRFLRFCPAIKGEIINNFQMFGRVIASQPSPGDSVLYGDGLNTARLERKCVMVLSVFDCDGLPYNDNDVTIDARIYYQGKEINVPVNIVHLTGGAHQVAFTPVHEGTHYLHLAVNGCSVQDSPFKFHVKARWRRHVGTWVMSNQCSGQTDTDGLLGSDTSTAGDPSLNPTQGHYWTCCGKMTFNSECVMTFNSECVAGRARSSPVRQATF